MEITVNDHVLVLFKGAKVIDAIRAYYTKIGEEIPAEIPRVNNAYYQRYDLDGELSEGMRLLISRRRKSKKE